MTSMREDLIQRAEFAQQAYRPDDMIQWMKKVAEMGEGLSDEERILFWTAYKDAVGARRTSWRLLSSIESQSESIPRKHQLAKEYCEHLQHELSGICRDIINVVDRFLLPGASVPEAKVYYLKLRGDFYRYLAEVLSGEKKTEVVIKSERSYQEALGIAKEKMLATHPDRLGLALNFAVFYFEIANLPDKACQLAKEAFEEAIAKLDTINEDTYKNSTLIMELLRDNIKTWKPEASNDEDGGNNEPPAQ